MNLVEHTARKLFARLEQDQLRYAVLRNYEDLMSLTRPDGTHTDVDLVIDSAEVPRWRQLLSETAYEAGWDAVSECDHWARSRVRTHNIEVFRLYKRSPLTCLQIDVFHGVLVLGLPLLDERELLESRSYDEGRGITRINTIHENVFRLAQIAGLYPNSTAKVERYRQKVLACLTQSGPQYRRTASLLFGPATGSALESLVARNMTHFQLQMQLMRAYFFAKYAAAHPLEIPRLLWNRARDSVSRFYTDQCGAVVRIHAPNQEVRSMVRSALDELVRQCFMDEWTEQKSPKAGWAGRRRMEQGAWIVTWSERHEAAIDLSGAVNRAMVLDGLWNYVISRHRLVTSRVSQATECA